MLELQKLKKEDFPLGYADKGEPYITFYSSGKIALNKFAVSLLRLRSESGWTGVSFYTDSRKPDELSISGDIIGWQVREGTGGGCVFNNKCLAQHVIDLMWERQVRPAGDTSVKFTSVQFRIAHLPIDDGIHKNIFTLIRKKRGK